MRQAVWWVVFVAGTLGAISVGPDYEDVSQIPHVRVELRYATTTNFMHQNLYGDFRTAYLHKVAAQKLRRAASDLQQEHPRWSLLIYDALRPRSVQRMMWEKVKGTPEQPYVANPDQGSTHNYGFAVDVTVCDADAHPLDMGTPFDSFQPLAEPQSEKKFLASGELTAAQIAHRRLLRQVMEKAGFIQLPNEWWHFDALPKEKVRSKYPFVD